MPSGGLQCFSPELYAPYEELLEYPYQCIAPTKKGVRCKLTVRADNYLDAKNAWEEAKISSDPKKRTGLLEEFILSHCCLRHHRGLLANDQTGTIDKVVAAYEVNLRDNGDKKSEILEEIKVEPLRTSRTNPRTYTSTPALICPQSTMGMRLRSGFVMPRNSRMSSSATTEPNTFVPYKSSPDKKAIYDCLKTPPKTAPKSGEVYSFTCASEPGFVKVGLTTRTAPERIGEWRSCHRDAKLSTSIPVKHVKRFERLVHLELAKHRHRMTSCHVCGVSHEEWFKASSEEVNQVIHNWKEVDTRSPLFEANGELTAQWQRRLKTFEGAITAAALLDILDAEDLARRAAKQPCTKIEDIESLSKTEILQHIKAECTLDLALPSRFESRCQAFLAESSRIGLRTRDGLHDTQIRVARTTAERTSIVVKHEVTIKIEPA